MLSYIACAWWEYILDFSLYTGLQANIYDKPPMAWFNFVLHMVMGNQVLQGGLELIFIMFLFIFFKKI